jgi:3-hydroxy-9,10-secoandrosta-1,3,5(10)-triene-9,17-dione monooxygenase
VQIDCANTNYPGQRFAQMSIRVIEIAAVTGGWSNKNLRGSPMSALLAETTATATTSDLYDVEQLLARARALAPKLRERSYATNKAGRIPDETIRDFWDFNLTYLLRPKRFGGPAMRPDEAFQAAFELGRGDGSAAWVWAVMLIHDLFVAHFPEKFQQEYWGKDRTLSASSFLPNGKPTLTKGGIRLSGKWSFCSGVDNADWLFLGAFFGPPSGGAPMPDIRYVWVPKGDYRIIDDWDVMGLCGTGSKSVVVEDTFVPDHRIVSHKEMSDATSPGSKLHSEPVYRAPIWSFVPFTISAPACGIAQGALEAFIDDMKVRDDSFAHSPLSKKPGMHVRVAEASAMIDCGNLLYKRSYRETIDKVLAGVAPSLEFRARSRRDQGYSVKLAKAAVGLLIDAGGGRGLYETNHVQRCFRDLQAMAGHIVASWDVAAYSYGQIALGGPPSDLFV